MASFHKPWTVSTTSVTWLDTKGRLTKLAGDVVDNWIIDLAVPCFGGHCAQDWADFVHKHNESADADDYVQPIENEHKIFGCNLWVEVKGVSETPPPQEPTPTPTPTPTGTLTLLKDLVQDPANLTLDTAWTLTATGPVLISGSEGDAAITGAVIPTGVYDLSESGPAGYTPSAWVCGGAALQNDGDTVTVAAGEVVACTITNTEVPE